MKLFPILAATALALPATLGAADAQKPANIGSKPASVGSTEKAHSAYTNINLEEFEKMRKQPNTVVLDVRTKAEFDRGHVPEAVNLDVRSAEFEKEAAKLDKSKIYLVHCAAGSRSVKACDKLAPLKIDKLYNFTGGYAEWMIKNPR